MSPTASVPPQTTAPVAPPSRLGRPAASADLRATTARGTIVNAAFQIGLAGLMTLRRVAVAAFLTASEFGLWGALLVTLMLVVFIKSVGTADKFVQQDEADQVLAFQKAFTIDLILSGAAIALSAVVLPIFAFAYGRPDIIVPGLLLSLCLLGNSLQAPIWIFYRRMEFVKQRTLQAIDPVVAFVVTVGLAAGGVGFWSLVIGAVAGSFAGAAAVLVASPYPLALRLERGTIRQYWSFSWPLAIAQGGGIATAQTSVLIASRTLGFAQVGAIGLAVNVTAFTDGVDGIVTRTLYPAICAVRHRADLLREAFVKSNRLALMWGMPFGIGVALFASDFVHMVLGPTWEPAIVLLQAFGIAAAIDQIGFNWTAFLRALDWTRPLAVLAVVQIAAFAVVTVPLLFAFGLTGFAIGTLVVELVNLAGRTYYLGRLFDGFDVVRHAARAIAPVAPAIAAVLAVRALGPDEGRNLATAIAEVALFATVVVTATCQFERALLREVVGYVRAKTSEPRTAAA
jgi:O-antigen/teichoic acid export membrane protein